MEQFIASSLMEREVEFTCLGGTSYSGRVKVVSGGVVTIEWDGKETYIAADKIIAAWPKDQKERSSSLLGFIDGFAPGANRLPSGGPVGD